MARLWRVFTLISVIALLFSSTFLFGQNVSDEIPEALVNASALVAAKDYVGAEKIYLDYIATKPEVKYDCQARRDLGVLYIRQIQDAKAEAVIAELFADIEDQDQASEAIWRIAKQWANKGQHAKALDFYLQIQSVY
ncbi:MAG: hypothetical protein JEZ07_15795, partial [Phycisphaerae bacterium]|nr:hypothetical protein [Phycisphaerae bacterium]